MKKKQLYAKKGFSLLELMAVVAITIIVTGTLFVGGNSKKAATEVEAVARQVAAQIRFLQNESLTGKKINNSYAHRFEFRAGVPDLTRYTLEYKDGGMNSLNSQVFNLTNKKVSFNPSSSIYFTSPLGNVDPISSKVITLESQRDASKKYYICVSSKGNVTESKQDPTSTCN